MIKDRSTISYLDLSEIHRRFSNMVYFMLLGLRVVGKQHDLRQDFVKEWIHLIGFSEN
jgi:hypothetical protein